MLGAAQPGARLKLLVQALTSSSLAGSRGSLPVPEELQVRCVCVCVCAALTVPMSFLSQS